MSYRIGVDVGDRSVGIAAIAYDDSGMPLEVLSAVSHIHDGGMDPSTGKSPQSRLATSGVARRARRLLRNRRRRLRHLDEVLLASGISVPSGEVPQTYAAWDARARLSVEYVSGKKERQRLLGLAIRHMARHRGWRNPWWSYDRLAAEPTPSAPFSATVEAAESRFAKTPGTWVTLGQLVAQVGNVTVAVRPRTRTAGSALALQDPGPVISQRLRQEDMLAELRLILNMQKVPADVTSSICRAVFEQAKPHVPLHRVGSCSLIPSLPRAASASLEFQEFRVRAAVANLRIKTDRKADRPLSADEHDRVVDALMEWRDSESPRWLDVAELLEVSLRDLKVPSIDDGGTSTAPTDRTSRAIEAKFKSSSDLGVWWDSASWSERAELVTVITDATTSESELSGSLAALVTDWSEESMRALETLKLDAGRCSYSQEALRQIVAVMRDQRCNVHDARKSAFGVSDDWQPPAPSFDDPVEHPTVARVNTIVRRYLMAAVAQWGLPETVVVEHVRSAFFGPTARAEFERELRFNNARREKVRSELTTQGIVNPSRGDERRYESIQRQNGMCLYCGEPVTMANSQLDHIIADSQGGSNRRDNLVAVCSQCNGHKGKLAFAVWARRTKRSEVSVELARQRLRAWNRNGLTPGQFKRLQRDVARRLGLDEDSESVQDRSIESTAYAAREIRARIQTYLRQEGSRLGVTDVPGVEVYSGAVTSQARRAGGVDDLLRLRGKDTKDRFDRRHHAIDAAVLTSLSPGVAVTLRTRSALRNTDHLTGDQPGWKEYRGASKSEQERFAEWILSIRALSDLLKARVDADRVAVVRPLRLRPSVGSVHRATVEPLVRVPLGAHLTADQILRTCDRRLYHALSELADGSGLDPDSSRPRRLGFPNDFELELFPSNAAYLKVRGGAVAIGDTIQHARVYAWRTKTGFGYGIVRVYTGEFPAIGFSKAGVDVLTAPLPPHSQSMRTANATLRSRIESGEARQIGWLSVDDELEIDVDLMLAEDNEFGQFLQALPERHWRVSGLPDSGRVSLDPAYLAEEGQDDNSPIIVSKVITQSNKAKVAAGKVLAGDSRIIRRTSLGRPRWVGSGLPASWSPREEAEKAFAE